MRLTSNMEYLIVPKGTKFMGSGKLGLTEDVSKIWHAFISYDNSSNHIMENSTFLKTNNNSNNNNNNNKWKEINKKIGDEV